MVAGSADLTRSAKGTSKALCGFASCSKPCGLGIVVLLLLAHLCVV